MSPTEPHSDHHHSNPKQKNESERCDYCGHRLIDGRPAGQDPVRIARAGAMLEAYMVKTGITAISVAAKELQIDLMHHAVRTGREFEVEIDNARTEYDAECYGDES